VFAAVREITERKQYERSLREATHRAERANSAKSAQHSLRPLTGKTEVDGRATDPIIASSAEIEERRVLLESQNLAAR